MALSTMGGGTMSAFTTLSGLTGRERSAAGLLVKGSCWDSRLGKRFIACSSSSSSSSSGSNDWEGVKPSEASSLIRLCEDLDYESCVNELRREALERNVEGKSSSSLRTEGSGGDEWDYKEALQDLRQRASVQAAEELAKKLNPSDYQATVSKLTDHIMDQFQQNSSSDSQNGTSGNAALFFLPVLTAIQGVFVNLSFAAAEASDASTNIQDRVPSWFGAAVLGLPVASYAVFSVYRDKVNPAAKLSDFVFVLGALVIVGNLVSSATLGVRLY